MANSVFVSKPTALTPRQSAFYDQICGILAERGLSGRSLGKTDFTNAAPLKAICKLMQECRGAVILGFRQVYIDNGIVKPETTGQKRIVDTYLPTPWNQIEAGLAYAQDLPLLIIRESGIEGGIFDIGSTDRFVHEVDLKSEGEWLRSPQFLQPFNEWCADVTMRQQSARA